MTCYRASCIPEKTPDEFKAWCNCASCGHSHGPMHSRCDMEFRPKAYVIRNPDGTSKFVYARKKCQEFTQRVKDE